MIECFCSSHGEFSEFLKKKECLFYREMKVFCREGERRKRKGRERRRREVKGCFENLIDGGFWEKVVCKR